MIRPRFFTTAVVVLIACICVIILSATSPIGEQTTAQLRLSTYIWSGTKWYPHPPGASIVEMGYRIDSDFPSGYVSEIQYASARWSAPSSDFQIHAPTSTTSGLLFDAHNASAPGHIHINDVVLDFIAPPYCFGLTGCTIRATVTAPDGGVETLEADIWVSEHEYVTGTFGLSRVPSKGYFRPIILH